MKKGIAVLLSIFLAISVFSSLPISTAAKESNTDAISLESTGNATWDAFINDPRFTNGVSWNRNKTPVLVTTTSWAGCAAYCVDYVKYCYNYNYPTYGTLFENINEIRAGDVIVIGNPGNNTGHWFVCLKRYGNNLYVAEGNASGKVRIGWNWSIKNDKYFSEDSTRSFTKGYHFTAGPASPAANVSASGTTVTVTWADTTDETGYDVYLVQAPWGWEDIKYQQSVAADSTSCVFYNIPAGTYAAFIIARPNADTAQGSWAFFEFSGLPLAAPEVSIGSSYYTYGQDIDIIWNAVAGATAYSYILAEYPEGYAYNTNTLSGVTNVNSVSFKASELKDGKYYFFVHASNSSGYSSQSNWVVFDVFSVDYIPVKSVEHNGHIYALYDYSTTWTFARDLCYNMGGHLVTVNDSTEEAFLEELINSGTKDAYWLGATNFTYSETPIAYEWVTGEIFDYTKWHSGEPSFSGSEGTREHFIELRKSYDYKWNDVKNTDKENKGFVLEIEPSKNDITAVGYFASNKYYVVDRNTTWTEAQTYCETLGGHLLCIDSAEESAFIDSLINKGSREWYYVGGKRTSGNWEWIDGATIDNVEWYGNLWPDHCNYLIKYRDSKKFINLPNAYCPAQDMGNIGYICEVENANTVKGDADGDGEITVSDALTALRIAAKLAEPTADDYAILDIDGDGAIAVNDALAILRVAAKLADSL